MLAVAATCALAPLPTIYAAYAFPAAAGGVAGGHITADRGHGGKSVRGDAGLPIADAPAWPAAALHLLGLSPACNTPGVVLAALAPVVCLFAGPILESLIGLAVSVTAVPARDKPRAVLRLAAGGLPHSHLEWLIALRNLAYAPLTEEWVFRCCVVPLLVMAGFARPAVAGLAALAFATAHAHHYHELRRRGKAPLQAVLIIAFQLSFTSIFGVLSTAIFVRTASLGALTVTHAFCNAVGAPDFGWVRRGHPLGRWRLLLAAAYAAGVVGFLWSIGPATAGAGGGVAGATCGGLIGAGDGWG
jgi:hypothetical protein